jgi:hypothetical protein
VPIVAAERLERVDVSARERDLLARRASFSVRVEIAKRVVEVRFDDSSARDMFARRFRDHVTEGEPEFVYYVSQDGHRQYFWSEPSITWRWPDGVTTPAATAFLADAAVVSAIVRSDPSLVSLHAAVVSHRGRIAAIGGDSWSGKSTTAFACIRLGMQFFSDERLLVRGRTVYPFQRSCSLRPHSRTLFAGALGDSFANLDWSDLSIVEMFGAHRIGVPGPLAAIFVLSGHGARAVARPIDHLEAMAPLFRWMDSRHGDFARLARLIELLAPIPCYALELGTPSESAGLIATTLEQIDDNAA